MHHMSETQNDLSQRLDGGPAYPVSIGSQHNQYACAAGMTLRDWFAGQALANSSVSGGAPEWSIKAWFGKNAAGITQAQIVAAQAYDIADAMLARRDRQR